MAVLIFAITKLFLRLKVHGVENVPRTGALLLVANHASFLDPTTIACGIPRQCHFLAKEELLEKPGLGFFLRNVNTHAIRRGSSDRAAIRQCVELLREGRMLLIFPEGTRTPDGNLQPAKPGAAMIALQSEATICPVYIAGTFEAMSRHMSRPKRARVNVYFGAPFRASEVEENGDKRARYDAVTRTIMDRIAQLRPSA